MEKLIALAGHPATRRVAIAGYVAAMVGLIGAFFIISLFRVEHSTYLTAAPTLEKGRPNAARGVLFDTPTGQFVRDARIRLSLHEEPWEGPSTADDLADRLAEAGPRRLYDHRPSQQVADARTQPTGLFHLQMTPSDTLEPGLWSLIVEAEGPMVREAYRAGAAVEVMPASRSALTWPQQIHRLPEEERPRHEDAVRTSEGPVVIDVLPRDGEVVRGLENIVYLRTYDRETGRPLSTTVEVEQVEGINQTELPATIETDQMGLAQVTWTPGTDQFWDLAVRPADDQDAGASTARLRITTAPAQFSLTLMNSIAVPGRPVEGYVKSLNRSGGMMVDLYDDEDWTLARAFGLGEGDSGLRFEMPDYEGMGKLQRVQVYGGIYGTSRTWDSRYLWLASGRSRADLGTALDEVVAFHADHSDDPYFAFLAEHGVRAASLADATQLAGWLRASLDAIPRRFTPAHALINSEKEAYEALEAWKSDIKRRLKTLTALGLLIGLMVVMYAVVLGLRRDREHRQALREADLEMAFEADFEGDATGWDEDPLLASRADDWVTWLQVAIVVTILGFFAAGILLLLSFM